jgi:hypothetical protein
VPSGSLVVSGCTPAFWNTSRTSPLAGTRHLWISQHRRSDPCAVGWPSSYSGAGALRHWVRETPPSWVLQKCRNLPLLVSAMIIVRLRASVAVFDCESCGAMSRGLIDMLDSRTSQASNLRQSVEIKGCPGEGELPVDLWAARDAASCLTRLPPWPHRRPPRRVCGYGWETA